MIRLLPPADDSLDNKIQHYILLILKASVVAAFFWALSRGEWEYLAFSVLALLLMFLPEFIESQVRINLPIEFDLVIVVFLYLSIFVGEQFNAYEHFWWWDAMLHTASGLILGFAGFLVLYVKVLQKKLEASPLLIGLIIFSFAVAFGAVWEIFEFSMDRLFGTNMQKNGLQDTMWDLIVDAGGGLFMAVMGTRFLTKRSTLFVGRLIHNFVNSNPGLAKHGRP